MAIAISGRQQGALPSNTEINPRGHVKAITTLSGTQLPEISVKRSVANQDKGVEQEEEQNQASKNTSETKDGSSKVKSPIKPYETPIPFPQRLKNQKVDKQFEKFQNIFQKIHINIPFADALAQMPSYAKFMKDILTHK